MAKLYPLSEAVGNPFVWVECYGCRAHVKEAWGQWKAGGEGVPLSMTLMAKATSSTRLIYQWFCERCCKKRGWLW